MPTNTANGENNNVTGPNPEDAEKRIDEVAEPGFRPKHDHPGIYADKEIAGERQHDQQYHQIA